MVVHVIDLGKESWHFLFEHLEGRVELFQYPDDREKLEKVVLCVVKGQFRADDATFFVLAAEIVLFTCNKMNFNAVTNLVIYIK